MSRLNKLIEELCPEGVEWKKLGDIAKRLKGTPITATLMKQISSEDGEIRIFAGGKTMINAHLEDIPNANITYRPALLVQSRGVIDFVYYDKPFTFKNEMWAYTMDDTTSIKFLYYYLKDKVNYFRDKAVSMGAFPQISLPITDNFEIPVPPLPVQEEIVRILDKFTTLEAELEAELDCRKRQYEFYRNQLLSFEGERSEGVKWKKLGDICNIKGRIGFRGYTINDQVSKGEGVLSLSPGNIENEKMNYDSATYITWEKYEESPEIKTYEGDIIFCKTGSTVGKVAMVENLPCEATINPQLVVLKEISINSRFLKYILASYNIQAKVKSLAGIGSVPNISQAKLASLDIPIPSLEEQQRIVSILDRFEALTTDLQSGLPAEIKARRKQYEYYREKLLTFKRCQN